MNLIIVESPTKARTFNRILKGKDYFVYATMGHIRDLPEKKISIDYEHDFKPDYKIMKKKEKLVAELKSLAKKNKQIILATDPDREGESISYHVAYLLGFVKEHWPNFEIKDKERRLKRIVFHEITEEALEEALKKPGEIRTDLVKAQLVRRTLDRIVGYELSPLLWKKLGKFWLSAGRVQTVALRFIVEREKEIRNFTKELYIQIYGTFTSNNLIKAKLVKKDDISYEQKFKLNLFAGDYTYTKTTIGKDNVETIKKDLIEDKYIIQDIKESVTHRTPPPPLTTSLLQQEAYNKHRYSSKATMRLAQDLYEAGLITYHRTDSFNLSSGFVAKAKTYIENVYGKEYALEQPRGYKTRSKNAQEAHEAIRPTKLIHDFNELKKDESRLTTRHANLYELIFRRAVSSQMKESEIKQVKISILSNKGYLFESNFQQVLFEGFLKLLNPEFGRDNLATPSLKKGSPIDFIDLETQESETKPPPRYNDASLIKTLEERGIGRPSTYAPTLSLITDKGYVEKETNYFVPSILGEKISDYLSQSFPVIFDINFTAQMEEELDRIADGGQDIVKLLRDFYTPFSKQLKEKKEDTTKISVDEKTDEICEKCGSPMVIKYSRFGRFLSCSTFPECKFAKPYLQIVPGAFCPEDGGRMVVRFTKTKRKFFGCENYPKCKYSTWKLEKKDDNKDNKESNKEEEKKQE